MPFIAFPFSMKFMSVILFQKDGLSEKYLRWIYDTIILTSDKSSARTSTQNSCGVSSMHAGSGANLDQGEPSAAMFLSIAAPVAEESISNQQ